MIESNPEEMTPESQGCPHKCMICYKHSLQIKWILSCSAILVVMLTGMGTAINMNMQDIRLLERNDATATEQISYIIQGIDDIKKAMGLETRMPPKLEALKGHE